MKCLTSKGKKPPVRLREPKPFHGRLGLDGCFCLDSLGRAAPSKDFPCGRWSELCLGLAGAGSRKGLEKCIY